MKRIPLLCWCLMAATLTACATEGRLGMIAKSSVDPESLMRSGSAYEEVGPVKGEACHYLILFIPFGDSDISQAVEHALARAGGDALINVATSKRYMGLWYSVSMLEWSCTVVQGTGIRFH